MAHEKAAETQETGLKLETDLGVGDAPRDTPPQSLNDSYHSYECKSGFAVATEGIDSSPITPIELRLFVVWAEIQIQLGWFRH